jgi:hypothetical protein
MKDAWTAIEQLEEENARLRAELARAHSQPLLDIAAERRRQIEVEGWTPEHDDQHARGEMARAAACYAVTGSFSPNDLTPEAPDMMTRSWPWPREWWKPRGGRRDLVRAGALILAEIERLDRATLAADDAAGRPETGEGGADG